MKKIFLYLLLVSFIVIKSASVAIAQNGVSAGKTDISVQRKSDVVKLDSIKQSSVNAPDNGAIEFKKSTTNEKNSTEKRTNKSTNSFSRQEPNN